MSVAQAFSVLCKSCQSALDVSPRRVCACVCVRVEACVTVDVPLGDPSVDPQLMSLAQASVKCFRHRFVCVGVLSLMTVFPCVR